MLLGNFVRMLKGILHAIELLVNPPAPQPRCPKCNDEMLLEMEIEQGACVDCLQPPFIRRSTPRPFGQATVRR